MQKYFDQSISGNWSYIENYENNEVFVICHGKGLIDNI